MEDQKKTRFSPYPFDGNWKAGYRNPKSSCMLIGQTVTVEVQDTHERFCGEILEHDATGLLKLLVMDKVYEFHNGEAKIISR